MTNTSAITGPFDAVIRKSDAGLVNRNDETVTAVFVGGQAVFLDGARTSVVGVERTGSFLRHGQQIPPVPPVPATATSAQAAGL